ncbi:MAG TPA: cyanophycin synthetase, partial [Blastocatellia bacterium]|nr:cyanophycin synthetase [Blastocatellia bacterium]
FRLYGIENESDVRALEVKADGIEGTSFLLVTPRGSVRARLPVAGRHNLYNALASAAAADYLGAPLEAIADRLGSVSSSRMRGEVVRFAEGFSIIDDSYNSNPRALVEMAATMCGDSSCRRRIVVAGEMLELGEAGAALHREAGQKIAELGVDVLIGVRGLARELVEGARHAGLNAGSAVFCETVDEAASLLEGEAREGDLILVKGSRGVKTETIVERMRQRREVKA